MDFGVSKRDKWRQLKFWRENTDEDRYVSVFPFHLYENLSSSISNPDPRTANADRFKRSDSSCGGRREEERRNKGQKRRLKRRNKGQKRRLKRRNKERGGGGGKKRSKTRQKRRP